MTQDLVKPLLVAAEMLRNHMDVAEYKHVVLKIIKHEAHSAIFNKLN